MKNIFNKKKNYIQKKYFFLFSLLSLILLFFYFLLLPKKIFFNTLQNLTPFYVIPEDREGKIIENQEKKILHLDYTNKDNINLINNPNLEYSIQLFSSDDYNLTIDYRSKLIDNNDSIFLPKELFVAILNYELISEYLLLYKNFKTRKKALEYCEKYSYYLSKCIIVNAKNLG